MKTYKYMHTINGCPASWDGEQICYSVSTRPIKLLNTLQELRKEQAKSTKFRVSRGWPVSNYGYRKVSIK